MQATVRRENEKNVISDEGQYKLFGTMNMFDFVPDFVYPVFEKNGGILFSKQ